jgi:hypothetical protein
MVIRPLRFNIILFLAAVVLALPGCQSAETKKKKEVASLRIHLQTAPRSGRSQAISVLRAAPITFQVENGSVLHEGHLDYAKIRETPGGFQIALQMNQQGQRLLEQYTLTNPNRRLAIRVRFGEDPFITDRWLAAPMITHRISDGLLQFTPDATRDEAEQIVIGLNNATGNNATKKKKAEEDLFGGQK